MNHDFREGKSTGSNRTSFDSVNFPYIRHWLFGSDYLVEYFVQLIRKHTFQALRERILEFFKWKPFICFYWWLCFLAEKVRRCWETYHWQYEQSSFLQFWAVTSMVVTFSSLNFHFVSFTATGDVISANPCPKSHQVFKSCGTACPLTCENYTKPPTVCMDVCVTGCFCEAGYVKTKDGNCVLPSEC